MGRLACLRSVCAGLDADVVGAAVHAMADEEVPMTQRYSWSWGDAGEVVVSENGVAGVVKSVPSQWILIRDHTIADTIAVTHSIDVAERIVNALNGVANAHDY